MYKFFLFLLIPALRFLINFNHYWYLRTVSKKYDEFLRGKAEDAIENAQKASRKAALWIQANQTEIKRRVLNAGLEDQVQSYMKPLGLGYVEPERIGALDNMLFFNKEIVGSVIESLGRAKGHYRVQALLSLSPLFWVELIIYLPREILKMAGLESSSKGFRNAVKIVQLIYWVLAIIYTLKQIT